MPSPWPSVRAVVDPFSGPPKPKHSCGIHEGFRAIPHEPKSWMHPRWPMIPFTGQRPITGSTHPFSAVLHRCHGSVALSELQTDTMQIVVFFPHSPVFLFPTSPSSISLKLSISVSSSRSAPFDVRHLNGPTPAPFVVAVRPPRLAPWGHYSPFFFHRCCSYPLPWPFWLLQSGRLPRRGMLRWRVRRLLLGGVGCDRGQHDAASDLVAVGAGRSPLRGAPLPWPHELALPSPPSDGGFARRARRSSARGLLEVCCGGGRCDARCFCSSTRGGFVVRRALFRPSLLAVGGDGRPPQAVAMLLPLQLVKRAVARRDRRAARTAGAHAHRRASSRARLSPRLAPFGRDVGGTMFGSPRGRHDAAANSGCRGRGADGRHASPAAVARARRCAS